MRKPDQPVTGAVLGQWLGLAERTVADLASRGLVVKVGRGRYDLKASVALYAGNLRAVAAGHKGDGDIDLVTERALLARQQRLAIEMKNAVTRGELVSGDEAEAAWVAMIGVARERLLAIPSRLSPAVAAMHTTAAVHVAIETEIHSALAELTGAQVVALA